MTAAKLHTFTMYSWAAGSARVRVADWAEHLGLHITSHQYAGLPTASPRDLARSPSRVLAAERALKSFDPTGERVLVSREVSPFSSGHAEERVMRGAARSTYDFDDALFAGHSLRRRLTGGPDKVVRSVIAADVVIAGNDYLAEWAAGYSSDVRVIPSCVEPSAYPRSHGSAVDGPPRIVWLGSASTEQYLVPLVPHLLRVHAATGAVLRVVSSRDGRSELDALGFALERVPWTADAFAASLIDCDVALAPLQDTPYARGKCAYKILQYAACGLQVIGNPVGANREALRRVGGLAVDGDIDWEDAIVQALSTPRDQREAAGARAVEAVTQHYSFAAWADSWRSAVGVEG